ncbi:MAG: hypothetical protein J5879_02915 [Clostridia bacterium]|nr:hypothetical protein [Clostridia bacterium]
MKKTVYAAILCLAAVVLQSCGIITIKPLNPPVTTSFVTIVTETEEETAEETVRYEHIPDGLSFEGEIEKKASEIIDGAINRAIDVLNEYPDPGIYVIEDYDPADYPRSYDSLTELQKQYYTQMYEAASTFGQYEIDEADIPSSNPFGETVTALYAIFDDYPEISMYFSDTERSGTYIHVPRYTLPNDYKHEEKDTERVKYEYEVYRAVFERILQYLPDGLTNYQKCLYFAAVICYACTYDYTYGTQLDSFQAYNALVSGSAVCAGYTQAFRLLCHAAGVGCKSLQGKTIFGDDTSHIWNVVQTNLGTRYIDVTWTDNRLENSDRDFVFSCFMMDDETLGFEGYLPDYPSLY